ncbi:MAG: hypothetical protein K1X65_07200 [Caldilineales bacterium]|nr:hypothetical protein [Caldilineales bacterium]
MPTLPRNTLFYGDNLPILREWIEAESVDLVYLSLHPPKSDASNSSRSIPRCSATSSSISVHLVCHCEGVQPS